MKPKPFDSLPRGDQALLWQPRHLEGISLFKARFSRFAYKPHCHSEYAIGVIEQGVQKFHHSGQTFTAPANTIISVNPGETHDGMSDTSGGYQYRMMYISLEKIREILSCHGELKYRPGYFNAPVASDPEAARLLHRALVLLDGDGPGCLEGHACLARALTRLFRRHAGYKRRDAAGFLKSDAAVRRAIEFIRENATENISLEDISAAAELSPYHFLRIFRKTTGLPPHAYLVQIRVERAKSAIEKGCALIDAAQTAGFSDQSHMTRCFKSIYGLPPGKYKKMVFS
ncbi:MAG: AraC family transcriptional regulator [Desulfobacterales bacterium]|nr:AraC family transcriptional regulator [Desulfobacterales bacterium]